MNFQKRTVCLPHCETATVSAGREGITTIVTSGGLQGGFDWPVDSGLGNALAETGRFIGWNRRFHPDTRGPFCIQTLETNAIDLTHIMDAYGVEEANLAGSSFGSSTSLTTAFWFPRRVKKLVLFHPTRITGESHMQRLGENVDGWKKTLREKGIAGALKDKDFCYSFPPERNDLHGGTAMDMDIPEFAATVEESYRRFGTHQCPVLGITASMLQRIDKPAIIIPGNDEIHPPEAANDLARLLPGGRLAENQPGPDKTISPGLIAEIQRFLAC